ncbi:MAG TPA: tetratricopeptide repeat protein [Candidatus Angelobacter sp.]|nr:tetratricopeptide repeat protein [Candidatus Angelobacter sp.]
MTTLDEIRSAHEEGNHELVLRLTEGVLAQRPGDDAAHEYRARAFLALGRADEAERHAADAVRLDPDEVRYRELLAETLSAVGAHRDAANEYGRLASNDPHQTTWTVAEAEERLGAAQPGMGVDAARRAVRLAPNNGRAQLALAHALARTGDARGALQSAAAAVELLPNDLDAREALADARWLAGQDRAAFDAYRVLADELPARGADRVRRKARTLYRRQAGPVGRLVARVAPLFDLAFDRGWLSVSR